MKLHATNDRRLFMQVACLAFLTILPISMIALNGARAFYGILGFTSEVDLNNRQDATAAGDLDEGIPLRLVTTALQDDDSAAASSGQKSRDGNTDGGGGMLKYGVYDPNGDFDRDTALRLRHVYVSWASFDRDQLHDSLKDLEKRGFEVLLTIEPWPTQSDKSKLLPAIVAGAYDSIIDELYMAKRVGNAGVYKQLLKKLRSIHRRRTLKFEDINYKFLKKIETLHYSKDNGAGGLSVYMRTLRATFNKAIKAGVTDESNYPFKNYTIKSGVPNRRALSEQELQLFKDKDLSQKPHLNNVRTLYLSSYYLRGINWMDMAFLQVKDIKGDFERISYLRQKTRGKRFSIKIIQPLKEIIKNNLAEGYKENDYLFPILKPSDEEVRHYPIIENKRKRLNKNLKEIANQISIPNFTIYSARHTYAMTLKRKGAPTNIIQDSLGHTTEEMTQNYLDSFENEIIDQYDELLI
jgi:integrase/recombinase XerD